MALLAWYFFIFQFMDIPISSPMGSYLIKSYGLGLDQQNPALRFTFLIDTLS